jgi:hypothetical protein
MVIIHRKRSRAHGQREHSGSARFHSLTLRRKNASLRCCSIGVCSCQGGGLDHADMASGHSGDGSRGIRFGSQTTIRCRSRDQNDLRPTSLVPLRLQGAHHSYWCGEWGNTWMTASD